MKIYWRIRSIPELQGLPAPLQRRIWRAAARGSWRIPRIWVGAGVMLALYGIGYLPMFLDNLFPESLLVMLGWTVFWMGLGATIERLNTIAVVRPIVAARRAALDAPEPNVDGSYHVPPAF
ncbi:MAG: hypothetical protein H0T53_00095 [Herpetosiphonaceae bacterium]|nr:hypothetical protein [Herpetosiphonaceae bacterium]